MKLAQVFDQGTRYPGGESMNGSSFPGTRGRTPVAGLLLPRAQSPKGAAKRAGSMYQSLTLTELRQLSAHLEQGFWPLLGYAVPARPLSAAGVALAWEINEQIRAVESEMARRSDRGPARHHPQCPHHAR